MDDYLAQIGAKLKAVRLKNGLTVRQLGELAQLDYGHISRMENGQMDSRISTLKKVADVLNCDVRRFL